MTIQNFPQDLQQAIQLITHQNLKSTSHAAIQHVVIAGIGSSGLAGTFVKQLVHDKLSVPLAVYQDYTLPPYVNAHTLPITVSYSGNTQETLAAFQTGVKRQAHLIAIIIGGILQALAQQHAIQVLPLPADLHLRA